MRGLGKKRERERETGLPDATYIRTLNGEDERGVLVGVLSVDVDPGQHEQLLDPRLVACSLKGRKGRKTIISRKESNAHSMRILCAFLNRPS